VGKGRKAERARDPWLTSTADDSSPRKPSSGGSSPGGGTGNDRGPRASSLKGGPGSGLRGALSSLPASELKRLLDMGGVSYRYAEHRPPTNPCHITASVCFPPSC